MKNSKYSRRKKKGYPLFIGCLGETSEEKKKPKTRITATTTGENVVLKNDGGSLRNYGYYGIGKLQIGTLLTPPLKYFGLTKSSHWLFVMENAPLRVDPGNFPLLFKPVFLSTSPVCPAAIYLNNCLCGLFPSSATDTWLFFMLMFSLFSLGFLVMIIYCPLPPLSALQTPPSLDFSEYFLLIHTYISPTRVFRPLTSYLLGDASPLLITRTGFRHWFLPRRFPERSQSVAGVAPSLGYLLLFLTVCPHKQNGGLLFLLLWYGGEGRGGGVVQQY